MAVLKSYKVSDFGTVESACAMNYLLLVISSKHDLHCTALDIT